MIDERGEVRAVLAAVSADPPPTRLTVDDICAAARGHSRPVLPRWIRHPSISMPSRQLLVRVVATAAAVGLLPGLVALLAVLTGRSGGGATSTGGAGGGAASHGELSGGDGAAPASGGGGSPPVIRAVEVAADQRTLHALVYAPVCPGVVALVARETAIEVVMSVAVQPAAAPVPERSAVGTAMCPQSTAKAAAGLPVSAVLRAPLGARRLVDARTGRTLPVLDLSRFGQVGYLPPGYRPAGLCQPSTVGPAAAGGSGSSPQVAQCTRRYTAALSGGRTLALTVTQYLGQRQAGSAGRLTWDSVTPTQVHGQAAELRLGHEAGTRPGQDRFTRQLSWTENGVTVTISSGPAARPDQLLADADLLRVADGIRW